MNASTLRGLAALCLLSILPRLGAFVVVQSTSISIFRGAEPHIFSFGGTWGYQPFDPALGTLESVTLETRLSATLTMTEFNFFSSGPPAYTMGPIQWTPTAMIGFSAFTADGLSANANLFASAQTVTIQPNASEAAAVDVSHLLTSTTTLPVAMGNFSNPALLHQAILGGNVFESTTYGNSTMRGTITATLTYNYSVTDTGASSAILFFLPLVGLLIYHWRSLRNLPGLYVD